MGNERTGHAGRGRTAMTARTGQQYLDGLRDDRTVYFLDALSGGRHEFSYILRATTPGTFNAMPARVSPMYVPDVMASSDTAVVTVLPEGIQ